MTNKPGKTRSILLIIFFQSCMFLTLSCTKKESEDTAPPVSNYVELRVLEDKTNNPIANAEVTLEKCASYDPVFGCGSYSTVNILITNKEGKYRFLPTQKVERITVKHPKYWQNSRKSIGDINLIPEAFSAVHLKKVSSYSSNCCMSMYASRPDDFIMYPQETRFAIPTDTTIYLRSYGNYENVVWWSIGTWAPIIQISSEGKSSPVFIRAFDTTRVEIEF